MLRIIQTFRGTFYFFYRSVHYETENINAAISLLTVFLLLAHVAYCVYAYLAFIYNPKMTTLFAVPILVLTCVHAVLGMSAVFLQGQGTRLDLYPEQNRTTVLQRLSAALIFPLLILHMRTFSIMKAAAENGQRAMIWLMILVELCFFAAIMTHVAVSISRALITLGWLRSRKAQRTLDRIVWVFFAVLFVFTSIAVIRTQIAMFVR